MANEKNEVRKRPAGRPESERKQIRISDFLHAFRKHYLLIIICAVVGLIVGIALSVVSYMRGEMRKRYAITTAIAVTSQNENGLFTSSSNNPGERDVYLAEEMVDSVMYVIKSDKMLNAAIDDLNLIGVTTKDIYDNLELRQYNETQIIEMTLYWRSAQEGIEILNSISKVSAGILIDTLKIGNVSVINEPKSKYLIGGNINANIWGYIAILGACVGAGLAVLDLLLRPTLLDSGDIENYFGLEIIGEIPERKNYFGKKKKASAMAESEAADFSVTDNYASAAHIIRNKVKNIENPFIYITSSAQNEGKTTAAAFLAMALADLGMRVLAIDLDTRNPMLGGKFVDKVDRRHSLNALYRGEVLSDDSVTHITGYLDILPAVLEKKPLPLDDSMLGLINSLGKKYDIVLIDTAPVGLVADTMSLNRLADMAIMVVKFDGAQLETINESVIRLEKSDMIILGCIVNGVKTLTGRQSYHYGNAYRSRTGSGYGGASGRFSGRSGKKTEMSEEWTAWERKKIRYEDDEASAKEDPEKEIPESERAETEKPETEIKKTESEKTEA